MIQYTDEMLDKESTRILDIKEETDQHLIEAYKKLLNLKLIKTKIHFYWYIFKIVLLFTKYLCVINNVQEQLESKNQMIEAFELQLDNAKSVIKDQHARADEDKQLFELKVIKNN